VTTASQRNTLDILSEFEVADKFDIIITQEAVSRTKPDPEGFLLAMEKAGVTTGQTLIFEDSSPGLEAAARSGAAYVQVYGYN
jgi:HAD superfamily hydrolase (TIGR01509 family)